MPHQYMESPVYDLNTLAPLFASQSWVSRAEIVEVTISSGTSIRDIFLKVTLKIKGFFEIRSTSIPGGFDVSAFDSAELRVVRIFLENVTTPS